MKERLNLLIKLLKLKKIGFAKEIGVSAGNLSDWLSLKKKSSPSSEALMRICEKYNVNINWLLTGEGEMFVNDIPIYNKACNSQKTCVYVLGKIAAGQPLPIGDEPIYCIDIDNRFIPKGLNLNKLLCFEAQGESMAPTIDDGELVFIEKTSDWLNIEGKICAVRVNGECTLKIVETQNNYIMLHPINKDFKTQIYKANENEITLVGKLVLKISIKVTES